MRLSPRLLYRLIKEQLTGPVDFSGWKINAHHVTLNMGSWKGSESPGSWFDIVVEGLYYDEKVAALKVNLPGGPARPDRQQTHITIAVSPTGKAKDSNDLPWANPPIPVSILGLKGQLQDHKMTGGGYTGLVLTKEGHRKLISGLAASGFNFPENISQKWAEETLPSVARESREIPLKVVKRIISEELRLLRESPQRSLALSVKDRGSMIDAVLYDVDAMFDALHRLEKDGKMENALTYTKAAIRGFVRIHPPGRSLGDCEGAWIVANIAGPGHGRTLHSVAAALSPNGLIIADRFVLSPAASGSFKSWSAGKEKVALKPKCITAPRAPGGVLDLGENPRKGLDPSKNPEHLNYAYRVTQEDEDVLYDLTKAHFELSQEQIIGQLMHEFGLDFFEDFMLMLSQAS